MCHRTHQAYLPSRAPNHPTRQMIRRPSSRRYQSIPPINPQWHPQTILEFLHSLAARAGRLAFRVGQVRQAYIYPSTDCFFDFAHTISHTCLFLLVSCRLACEDKFVVCRVDEAQYSNACEKVSKYFKTITASTEDFCGCCDGSVPPSGCNGVSCCNLSAP